MHASACLSACAYTYPCLTVCLCLFGRKGDRDSKQSFWLNHTSINWLMSYHAEKPFILLDRFTQSQLHRPTVSHVDNRYLYNYQYIFIFLMNTSINDDFVVCFLTKIRIIEEDELLPAVLRHHLHDDLIEIDRWADH